MRKIWRPAAWPDASGDPKRLRILVLTNLYPPHYIGGYELVCLDVVNHLRRQGHAVTVLTSSFGLTSPALDGEIHRTLTFQTPLALSRGDLIRREWQARQAFRRAIARSAPDVIYHFCLFGIPKSLLYAAQRIGVPVVYDFSAEWLYPDCGDDLWFRFWGSPAGRPHRQVAKAVLRRFLDPWFPTGRETLDLSRSYFTSERIKEIFLRAGFPVADAAVIYRGVDTRRFQPAPERIPPGPLPLLFAGRITKDKGLHTVIEALGILTKTGLAGSVSLTVAGPEQDATYANEVRRTIRSLCLEDQIRFVGLV
ncbi:MAG: glycosyltransferase family 4 protein, partial [Candidatus Methylomirabilota bacterium]